MTAQKWCAATGKLRRKVKPGALPCSQRLPRQWRWTRARSSPLALTASGAHPGECASLFRTRVNLFQVIPVWWSDNCVSPSTYVNHRCMCAHVNHSLRTRWAAAGVGDAVQTIQLYAPGKGSLVYSTGHLGMAAWKKGAAKRRPLPPQLTALLAEPRILKVNWSFSTFSPMKHVKISKLKYTPLFLNFHV